MNDPRVTVVVAPRERFELSLESLEALYDRTTAPFELVYVDGGSPRKIAAGLRSAAGHHGFELVRTDRYLAPNHARELGWRRARTEFVAFVDNDLLVHEGWLDTLLRCADETGAWVVGPLYLEGSADSQVVHTAAGDALLDGPPGRRSFSTVHRHQGERLDELSEPLRREACGFVEFHCMLVRRDALERVGGLDPELLSTREHLDLCLRVHEAGGEVWFEPAAVVTYLTPPPLALTDVRYFLTRWSDAWSARSLERFCDVHGIDPSYASRIEIMRQRRQVAFDPVRAAARRLGPAVDHQVGRVLRRVEPALNRRLVRIPEGPDPDGAPG